MDGWFAPLLVLRLIASGELSSPLMAHECRCAVGL